MTNFSPPRNPTRATPGSPAQAGHPRPRERPRLETAAICDVVLADALKSLEAITKRAADQTAAAQLQAETSARQVASGMINNASDWLSTKFKEAAQEATAMMLAELREETARAEAASRTAVRAAWTAGAIGAAAGSLMVGYGIAGL